MSRLSLPCLRQEKYRVYELPPPVPELRLASGIGKLPDDDRSLRR
jgi:hypothetical protein